MANTPTPYEGYVEPIGPNGWLNVKIPGLGTANDIWPLPEYLRVKVTGSAGREQFQILEGRLTGKKGNVSLKGHDPNDDDTSYFEPKAPVVQGLPYRGPASLIFHRRTEVLEVVGVGSFDTFTDPSNPVPIGTFDLEIPYEPHGGGQYYTNNARYAKTWFRVGHQGDRFLHPGSGSLGCITMREITGWDTVYNHLIISRKDARSVGTVKVENS